MAIPKEKTLEMKTSTEMYIQTAKDILMPSLEHIEDERIKAEILDATNYYSELSSLVKNMIELHLLNELMGTFYLGAERVPENLTIANLIMPFIDELVARGKKLTLDHLEILDEEHSDETTE